MPILDLHDKMKEAYNEEADIIDGFEEVFEEVAKEHHYFNDTPIQRGIKEDIAIKMLKENGLFEEYEKRVADYTLPCGG